MALDSSLDAALKGVAPLVCLLVKIELPDHTILVIDGAGEVVFDAETYTGEDSEYGALENIETISEQVGTEAPMLRLSFLPSSLDALESIKDPVNQGSAVQVWLGAVNDATGALIGEPESLFIGELDTVDVEIAPERTVLALNITSTWERLFDLGEGQRLNNAFIQSIYSGALGAEFVIAIQRDLPWGYDGPRPAVVSDVIGGSPGRGTSPITGGGSGGTFGGSTGGSTGYSAGGFFDPRSVMSR